MYVSYCLVKADVDELKICTNTTVYVIVVVLCTQDSRTWKLSQVEAKTEKLKL